ncbi:MAG TPA: 2-phospho-L-lactate guanylyltransferase [Steroidobacteraceae bacterium]|nr:2-phospho-L-lactate guanylyltransferase [Steroidobacteraceae bacterium]
MRVECIVPVKDLARGKSRLASALTEAERVRLIRAMLARVIDAATSVPALARASVLTIDPDLVPRSAEHLADSGEELNASLSRAALARRAAGADMLLILAADLPFVTAEEIGALIEAARAGEVVAAPDWKETGTNALAFPLAHALPMRFGPGSLAAHEAEAHAAGLGFALVRQPGLAFDVDEPHQLEALARDERYAFLR